MATRFKKLVIDKISKLGSTEHEEIFKILDRNNIPYTKNSNGVFFNLNTVSEEVINEINTFVSYCQQNQEELDAYDKKINECKINNNLNDVMQIQTAHSMNAGLNNDLGEIIGEKVTDVRPKETLKELINVNTKAKTLVNMLEHNLDKVQKKNHNTKYMNAKKRYSRKMNPEKKSAGEIMNILTKEQYKYKGKSHNNITNDNS